MLAEAHLDSGWAATLDLEFRPRGGRTVVSQQRHHGPLTVQRPFHPEGAPCHLYILHPPGGVVGGDQLSVNVHVAGGAHALLTAPASGKHYRSDGRTASQQQHLHVAPAGILEWLPQDNILFDGCRARLGTHIHLAPGARFIGWDVTTLGRPACGEGFASGWAEQTLALDLEQRPLLRERNELVGGSPLLEAAWGLQGQPSLGSMLAAPADDDLLAAARAALADAGPLVAATRKGEVLIVRGLGPGARALLHCFTAVWAAIRPLLLGRPACPPRIWTT